MLFSNAIYKLFRGNGPGQKCVATYSGRNFMGVSSTRLVVQGKIGWRKKSRTRLPCVEIFCGVVLRGVII